MTTSTVSRAPLRTQEGAYDEARLVCGGLTSGASFALASPKTPPEPTYSEAFSRAMQALTSPDWQGFAQQSVETVRVSPARFGEAALTGIYEYIKGELQGYADLGKSIVGWSGDVFDCIADIGPGGVIDPDEVLGSEACRPFHSAASAVQSIGEVVQELTALGFAGVLDLIRELLSLAVEVFDSVLREGLQLLGDQAEEIKLWLASTSREAAALGEILGTLVGAILIEVGTAGVGRAVKAARLVRRLPVAPGISGLQETATVEDTVRLRTPTVPTFGAISPSTRRRLDALADVFQTVLNKHGKRFSKNLTVAKLRILKKYVPAKEFKRFKRMRRAMAAAIAEEFRDLQGTIKTYGQSVEEVREYTRRVLAFHYSDAVVGEDDLDLWNIVGRKDALLPEIFESNHIFERRLFERLGRSQFNREFDILGWTSPENMDSVLLTAGEHTGSVRAMLRRQGLADADINRIAPPKSVTAVLLERIKFRDEWPGPPTQGMLVVDKDTPFSTVFSKYAEIYKGESPDLWEGSLRGKFVEWKNRLGLDVEVP